MGRKDKKTRLKFIMIGLQFRNTSTDTKMRLNFITITFRRSATKTRFKIIAVTFRSTLRY